MRNPAPPTSGNGFSTGAAGGFLLRRDKETAATRRVFDELVVCYSRCVFNTSISTSL